MNSAADVLKLIEARASRVKFGDSLPRRPGWFLECRLGSGGFGEVWLAVNREAQHLKLAVKFGRDVKADGDLVNERDVISKLMAVNPHPSLVALKDVSFDGELPWLSYEYVSGGDLTELIHHCHALPADERVARATAAFRELSAVVAELHKQNIVHRDLKPSNILLEAKTRRLRVTDFGISGLAARQNIRDEMAGVTSREEKQRAGIRGSHTPLYASPQQKAGNDADPRDDVHALGVIAYQLFTGHLTHGPGADANHDLKDQGVPIALVELVTRCVAQTAGRRPENAGQILAVFPSDEEPIWMDVDVTPVAADSYEPQVYVAPQVPKSVLAPLPKKILELEGHVASLELTIGKIEKGTHPDMAKAVEALATHCHSVEAVLQRLMSELDADPKPSATSLCRLYPDLPVSELMPVIASLQRRVELKQDYQQDNQQLMSRQLKDFEQHLEEQFAPKPGRAFPLLKWHALAEHFEVRRYRFAPTLIELPAHAEEYFKVRVIEESLWKQVTLQQTEELVQKYLERLKEGNYTEAAERMLDEIQSDREEAVRRAERKKRKREEAEEDARREKVRERRRAEQEEETRREQELEDRKWKKEKEELWKETGKAWKAVAPYVVGVLTFVIMLLAFSSTCGQALAFPVAIFLGFATHGMVREGK